MQARGFLSAVVCAGLVLTAPGAREALAGPALLVDAADGRVLYAEDIDNQWYPASLTKIMTAYLAFEAIKSGKLTLEAKIPTSEIAHAQPPSKVGLPVGAEMTVDLALKALIIKSANDVAVMLAEAIGGSVDGFVEKMNATAKRLGMSRTRFVNPNGLPAPEQVTTARDLARLSQAVVRDYPEYGPYWAQADMRIGRRRLGSHNQLLKTYDGADGLKTGFICDSGFNVVATATRDGRRLMAVVLGEATGRDRAHKASALLEHGFQTYGWKTYFEAPRLDAVPIAPDAKSIVSIRETIFSYECGNRPRRRMVAKAKRKPVAGVQQKAAETPAGAAVPPAAAAAAPASAAPAAPAAPAPGAKAAKPKAAQAPAAPPAAKTQ